MGDSKEEREKHLCPLGCQDHDGFITALRLLSLVLLAALLVAVLVKGSKVPSSQEQEKEKQRIHQDLDQLKAGLDRLCRPCPWDWTLFQGNCYFFSTFQQTWKDSVTACKEVGAQLVVIKSDEEQSFLQQTSKKKGNTWMGLSDLKQEGTWLWVDGSPLKWGKYWSPREPNNLGNEDCTGFSDNGWNDNLCSLEQFWICKKPASPCPRHWASNNSPGSTLQTPCPQRLGPLSARSCACSLLCLRLLFGTIFSTFFLDKVLHGSPFVVV
ncbi:CD209 antigen-like protein C [Mesocricetus auratus]|uniref:CD209 antigen-like protein C n=1 Tax=Mesocricetus auratus TaxID=10036 RepID=A0ABM2WB55_MESAU|nr:CD209 antigen-like protein C [Mesocricetus auratus]